MASTITVRRLDFPIEEPLPRYWFNGSAVLTHAVNGLNLIFPLGERFFVRSVLHYQDRVEDPALLDRVRGFAGQESQHGRSHEQAFRVLEEQGFEIQSWLDWYDRVAYQRLEQLVPPAVRLSITVALEHFTATMAELELTNDFLAKAHPSMADLLRWHAAEEIEHKSVAFDVLKLVHPSWLLRIFGAAWAAAVLMFFWGSAMRHLHRQDPESTRERRKRETLEARAEGHRRTRFLEQGLLPYLRPGFHPDDIDNAHLAAEYLAGRV